MSGEHRRISGEISQIFDHFDEDVDGFLDTKELT